MKNEQMGERGREVEQKAEMLAVRQIDREWEEREEEGDRWVKSEEREMQEREERGDNRDTKRQM